MKHIRENIILEKFTENSDPISDLGIGMMYQIRKWVKNHPRFYEKNYDEIDYLWFCAKEGKLDFVKYLCENGATCYDMISALIHAGIAQQSEVFKYILSIFEENNFYDTDSVKYVLKRVNKNSKIFKIGKEFLKDEDLDDLNEKFTEGGDPISDMKIGMKHSIDKFIEVNDLYYISNSLLKFLSKLNY